jgi:hypothetical protein
VDWVRLAEGGDQWRALVNAVMNLGGPQNVWMFITTERLATSRQRLRSVESDRWLGCGVCVTALREAPFHAVCAVPGTVEQFAVVKIRAGGEFEITRTTTTKYTHSIREPFDNLS